MTREESAYVAFGQYWLQARHQETARLWMTNIISIVFGALLAVVAWQGLIDWYVAAFGLSLALFGFFTNHALRVLSVRYSRVAATLMDIELGLGDYRRFIEGGDKQGVRGTWENLWSLHIAYVMFYCFGIAGWAALLTMTRNTAVWTTALTFILILLAVLLFYRFLLWPRESEAEKESIASAKRQKDKRKASTASEPID
jgi:hypothetical protein